MTNDDERDNREVMELTEMDELLTTREAATLLKTTTRTIYRWIEAGVLPAAKFGGRWRIRRRDLEAFWKERDGAEPEVERTNFQRDREALQQLERATSAGADVSG